MPKNINYGKPQKEEDDLMRSQNEWFSILRGRLSVSQLILLYVYGKQSDQSTTIDELTEVLKLPRSTIIDHLKLLENDGLLLREKEGRTWELFKPQQKYAEEMQHSLNMLKQAYVHALGYISQRRLKEVEELKNALPKKEDEDRSS